MIYSDFCNLLILRCEVTPELYKYIIVLKSISEYIKEGEQHQNDIIEALKIYEPYQNKLNYIPIIKIRESYNSTAELFENLLLNLPKKWHKSCRKIIKWLRELTYVIDYLEDVAPIWNNQISQMQRSSNV